MKSKALYARYVDDILVIYDTTKINLHTINTYINKTHNNIQLNPTHEEQNSVVFLDLTITCRHTKLEVDIYRKPTATDTTINFLSNHPIEQEMAAFRFHITRMHSLPLNPEEKQREWVIIQSIAKNNNFPQHLLLKLNRQILHKVNNNKKLTRMTKNLDYIYLPQPKDQKNYQFVQKHKYRQRLQDFNNTAPSHKTQSTNPVKRT